MIWKKICTEDYSVNLVDMADNTEDNKTVNDNPNDAKSNIIRNTGL